MMMPLGETVNVTFRNFLALALACGYETKKNKQKKTKHMYLKIRQKKLLPQVETLA